MKGTVFLFIATNVHTISILQLTIHETQDPNDPSYMLMMKGAPEQLLDNCSTILIGGQQMPLTAKLKEAFSNAFIEFASNGESVIGKY